MDTKTMSDSVAAAWAATKNADYGWAPLAALAQAKETPWLVDGVIPANSIIWMVGEPACGKTFTMMDIAACVSTGRPWMGRQCDQATVIYVAAEGGPDIHIRRAAAELAAGVTGPMRVIQARPVIADAEGLSELAGMVHGSTNIETTQANAAFLEIWDNYRAYLTAEELENFKDMARFEKLKERKDAGQFLNQRELQEFAALEKTLAQWGCSASELEYWGEEMAETRLPPVLRAAFKHWKGDALSNARSKKALMVIDTFSQTAADDTKAVVSRYVKHLRDLIEQAEKAGGSLSVVVIDHLTKAGGTFMGAQAKQGDSDAMIEIERMGQLVTVSCPDKMKAAKPFDPIHLELVPYVLEGYADAMGRPLASLIVKDGERLHRIRQAAGTNEETSAAVVLGLLADVGKPCHRDELRERFLALPAHEGKKPDSAKRAFLRALESLTDDEVIEVTDGVVSYALV